MAMDNWDDKFKSWKERKRKELEELGKPVKEVEKPVEKAREIKRERAVEPNRVKILKVIIVLVPLLIIGYLIFNNFIASQEFDYFYDIGSKGENYLAPATRVSEQVEGYREMTGGLVYFDVPISRGSEKVEIRVRFKDNFPENEGMSLGAKDQEVWHYKYKSIYNPALDSISEFPSRDGVYLVNSDLRALTLKDLKYENGSVVATDSPYTPLPIIQDFEQKETTITTSLRGGHAAYIYIKGDLRVSVKKQDINWYEGSDELEIGLYDLEDNLIANATIPDDGIIEVNKEIVSVQEGVLSAENLKEGVYKIEFGDFDGLIREIKINTNKIVMDRVFLADNSLYNVETKPSSLYFELPRSGQVRLMTYHSDGIQNLSYAENGVNKSFDFYKEDEPLYIDFGEGKHQISFPENDVIVSGVGYFAFSEESYFEPFKQRVVNIQNDMNWIRSNVDYLVTDYEEPIEDSGWLIAETEFNLEEDELFVKDNKLNFVFRIPHLSNEEYSNNSIPIDWIEVKVYKPGVI